jgi:hypothetical protein
MTSLFGWDMSHYQKPSIGNAIQEGIGFITHKAGGDADDPTIATWWDGVKDHRGTDAGRIVVGAYWVLYPGDAAGRADAFLARLDATCPGWRDAPFVLQADCERWRDNSKTQPGKADIDAFCARLRAKVPGLMPVVYASKGQYGNALDQLGYPLWNANYPSNASGTPQRLYAEAGGDTGPGWGAYSGRTPEIWQFSSTAEIGGQSRCDANAYRGDLAGLLALVTRP